ncbi:hypothetical protein ONZ51_g8248 [Trametes cubensis]|uniref:Uncharacterized protein n=1 Tax=Trametes cubensis TaxID=1111947 RepID=A0AAD7TNM3_9APHY|nr:hypothetical protein ONZ51_g8248 [Trametes cubensis]
MLPSLSAPCTLSADQTELASFLLNMYAFTFTETITLFYLVAHSPDSDQTTHIHRRELREDELKAVGMGRDAEVRHLFTLSCYTLLPDRSHSIVPNTVRYYRSTTCDDVNIPGLIVLFEPVDVVMNDDHGPMFLIPGWNIPVNFLIADDHPYPLFATDYLIPVRQVAVPLFMRIARSLPFAGMRCYFITMYQDQTEQPLIPILNIGLRKINMQSRLQVHRSKPNCLCKW